MPTSEITFPYDVGNGTKVSMRMVLKSAGGYYIGRLCIEEGEDRFPPGPYSRESVQYFETEQDAKDALKVGAWTFRDAIELDPEWIDIE